MGQLRTAYQAPSEFFCLAVIAELKAEGINCVVLKHELPQQPGYTFELKYWAELLVDESRLDEAREIGVGTAQAIAGEEWNRDVPWPPAINLRSNSSIGSAQILLFCGLLGLEVGSLFGGFNIASINGTDVNSVWYSPLSILNIVILAWLLKPNWELATRTARSAATGLCALPLVSLVLAVSLVWLPVRAIYKWLAYLPQLASGKPKQ